MQLMKVKEACNLDLAVRNEINHDLRLTVILSGPALIPEQWSHNEN